jgi:uncharacterized coiled-coil protein SlyX
MSAPRDPWKDIESELLKNIGAPRVQVSDLPPDTFVARFFAARAADAARHQQEIAAKDAELDKLRVFLGDASPKSDALRRQFDAEIATLRATVDQQAETIHQLQATLPELHDAIERQSAQIAALTDGTAMQHARKQADADGFQRGWHAAVTRVAEGDSYRDLAGLVPIIDERVRDRLEAAEARCATLTAALEDIDDPVKALKAQAEREGAELDYFWVDRLLKDVNWLRSKARAALAAAPQGGTPK